MPFQQSTNTDGSTVALVLGLPQQPPPPPSAPAAVTAQPVVSAVAPVVSSTPRAGQGVATDQAGALPATVPAQAIQVLTADPVSPIPGQIWYRSDTSQLCVRHNTTTTKRVTLA